MNMKKTGIVIMTIGAVVMLCAGCNNIGAGTLTEEPGNSKEISIASKDTEVTEELAYDEYGLPFIKNQIVIMFDLNTEKKEIEALIDDIGGKTIEYIDGVNTWVVQLEGEWTYEGLEELIERLDQKPEVVYIDLNYKSSEGQPN